MPTVEWLDDKAHKNGISVKPMCKKWKDKDLKEVCEFCLLPCLKSGPVKSANDDKKDKE